MHNLWVSVQKANEAMSMGKKWQESILDICDQHFFFTEVCAQQPLLVAEILHATLQNFYMPHYKTCRQFLLPPV